MQLNKILLKKNKYLPIKPEQSDRFLFHLEDLLKSSGSNLEQLKILYDIMMGTCSLLTYALASTYTQYRRYVHTKTRAYMAHDDD